MTSVAIIAAQRMRPARGRTNKRIAVRASGGGDQIGALKLFEPELVERFGSEVQLERIERAKSLIGKQLPNLVTVLEAESKIRSCSL